MADAQLLHLAKDDRDGLTDEALALLKDEFTKRGLNTGVFDPIEKVTEDEEYRQPIAGFYNPATSTDDALLGRNYLSIKNPVQEQIMAESQRQFADSLSRDDIQRLIKKAETSMLVNGIIFFVGFIITIASFLAVAEKGGVYYLAWGPVIFGGFRFFRAFEIRHKYKTRLNGNSGVSNENPPMPD